MHTSGKAGEFMARTRTGYEIGGVSFTPLPGKSRNFQDAAGNVYSRRQMDAIRAGRKAPDSAPKLAPGSAAKRQRRTKAGAYKLAVNSYKRQKANELGVKPSQVKVRGNSAQAREFQAIWKDLQSKDPVTKKKAMQELAIMKNGEIPTKYATAIDTKGLESGEIVEVDRDDDGNPVFAER